MIKIAVTAALAAIVVADAAFVPASTPASATTERPRGLKGDRLQIRPQGPGCTDAVWPSYSAECVGNRREPADTHSNRIVRSV
ncbi:MAG: hypothetical protein K2Z80_19735 [Xanthobacteraceae bacterium]|nr:hypothetical protein [Xanthobacteraceae bacterium]